MIYFRGSKKDFDEWENDFGLEGWGYDDVMPFFKKFENNTAVPNNPAIHGYSGPIEISTFFSSYVSFLLLTSNHFFLIASFLSLLSYRFFPIASFLVLLYHRFFLILSLLPFLSLFIYLHVATVKSHFPAPPVDAWTKAAQKIGYPTIEDASDPTTVYVFILFCGLC